MTKINPDKPSGAKNVRVNEETLNLVRQRCDKTGVSIIRFFDAGARDKLLRESKSYQDKLRKFLIKKAGAVNGEEIYDYIMGAE